MHAYVLVETMDCTNAPPLHFIAFLACRPEELKKNNIHGDCDFSDPGREIIPVSGEQTLVQMNGSCVPGSRGYAFTSKTAQALLRGYVVDDNDRMLWRGGNSEPMNAEFAMPVVQPLDVFLRKAIHKGVVDAYCASPPLVRMDMDIESQSTSGFRDLFIEVVRAKDAKETSQRRKPMQVKPEHKEDAPLLFPILSGSASPPHHTHTHTYTPTPSQLTLRFLSLCIS